MLLRRVSEKIWVTTGVLLSLLFTDMVQCHSLMLNDTAILEHTAGPTGFPPCDALIAANLSSALVMPDSSLYTPLVDAYWSLETRKAPWCFVLPSDPSEVSRAITALSPSWAGEGAGEWHIAIRSGGHMGFDSNNVEEGVVIDLSKLNVTTYDKATNVARVGTGAHWQDVYDTLYNDLVSVTGGRQGSVGVGGFVLGGGIGWTTLRRGFACDNVVNFEVALANGRIINANRSANADLWRALRGGSSNYGIVTRFDLDAFPATNYSFTTTTISMEHIDEVIDAIGTISNLNQLFEDDAMLVDMVYSSETHNISILVLQVNTKNDANTTAFDAISAIPPAVPAVKQSVTIPESADSDVVSSTVTNSRNAKSSITFVADRRIIQYVMQQQEKLIAYLNNTIGPQGFGTIFEFQPIPGYIGEVSAKRGGNVLGLDQSTSNKLLLVVSALLTGHNASTQVPRVSQHVAAMTQDIRNYSDSLGLAESFTYLNYAGATQDPLGNYGSDNVAFMKRVANKYDPEGFFQSRVPGGFKISRVA